MYAGLLPWNSNNKRATGSRFLDKFSIVYVWRSTRQETLAEVVLMSVISHTFLPVGGPTLGSSLRLNCIPDTRNTPALLQRVGTRMKTVLLRDDPKRRPGQVKGLHAILSNYTERVFSLPPHPPMLRRKSQRSTLGFKPSSQSVSPGWTNQWLSQKRPRQAKTRSSTVHGYLSHRHTLDARPHICTRY